jgi:hypothetical protein
MERTALCFVVGSGWIRNCEKPGISLPSPLAFDANSIAASANKEVHENVILVFADE